MLLSCWIGLARRSLQRPRISAASGLGIALWWTSRAIRIESEEWASFWQRMQFYLAGKWWRDHAMHPAVPTVDHCDQLAEYFRVSFVLPVEMSALLDELERRRREVEAIAVEAELDRRWDLVDGWSGHEDMEVKHTAPGAQTLDDEELKSSASPSAPPTDEQVAPGSHIAHVISLQSAAMSCSLTSARLPDLSDVSDVVDQQREWEHERFKGPWWHNDDRPYARPQGHALRLIIRLLFMHLPLNRVKRDPISGKIPKTATGDGYEFHRQHAKTLAKQLREPLSLSQVFDVLKEFVSAKTKTCRRGKQTPERKGDHMICALKWTGFRLTEDEVKDVCMNTTLSYASAVLASDPGAVPDGEDPQRGSRLSRSACSSRCTNKGKRTSKRTIVRKTDGKWGRDRCVTAPRK